MDLQSPQTSKVKMAKYAPPLLPHPELRLIINTHLHAHCWGPDKGLGMTHLATCTTVVTFLFIETQNCKGGGLLWHDLTSMIYDHATMLWAGVCCVRAVQCDVHFF